jgi:hypothetical protein
MARLLGCICVVAILSLWLRGEVVMEALDLGGGCVGDEFRKDESRGVLPLGAGCEDGDEC